MNKTQAIFETFTARYGSPQPKDGQDMQAVAQSYEAALGMYSLTDLNAACSSWMASTKYPRWPEPAEILDALRSFGARPERPVLELPQHVAHAANDASAWFRGIIARPLPDGAWPCTWDDAVLHVILASDASRRGKSFGWMMTRAWMDGLIPQDFDRKAAAYFDLVKAKQAAYLAGVRRHGALAVHERRVRL